MQNPNTFKNNCILLVKSPLKRAVTQTQFSFLVSISALSEKKWFFHLRIFALRPRKTIQSLLIVVKENSRFRIRNQQRDFKFNRTETFSSFLLRHLKCSHGQKLAIELAEINSDSFTPASSILRKILHP